MMSKSKANLSECRICSATACYSYYGAIACPSCKMFFKRNAEQRKKTLQCRFDGQCEVTTLNRHICSACRLAKCFKVGMCAEMIRAHRATKEESTASSTIIPRTSRKYNRSQQLTTLNLLEQDHSLLSPAQWMLLSNLIHAYDEHNALPIAKHFMKHLDTLHPKLRFKIDSSQIVELVTIFYQATEPFIQSNQHFASLPTHDRSIVLRGAVDNVSCLGGGFIMRQSGLTTNFAFRNALETTFGTIPYRLTLNAISLLDQDVNLVKLTLSLFASCTNSCTLYDQTASFQYLTDNQSLLCIQNAYAELIWKYLLYYYRFDQAVIRFSRLIRCLVMALTVRTHLQTIRHHTDVVEALIQKIEQHKIKH